MSRANPRRSVVLQVITARPVISFAELRAQLPDMTAATIHNALVELRKAGAIENAAHGQYRVREPRPTSAARHDPALLAKMMAGR